MKADCIINENKFLLTPETYTQEQWHKMFGILKEKFLLLHEENKKLNNIIIKIEQYLIDCGVDDEILKLCGIFDVNGVELRKYIIELKEGKK